MKPEMQQWPTKYFRVWNTEKGARDPTKEYFVFTTHERVDEQRDEDR